MVWSNSFHLASVFFSKSKYLVFQSLMVGLIGCCSSFILVCNSEQQEHFGGCKLVSSCKMSVGCKLGCKIFSWFFTTFSVGCKIIGCKLSFFTTFTTWLGCKIFSGFFTTSGDFTTASPFFTTRLFFTTSFFCK